MNLRGHRGVSRVQYDFDKKLKDVRVRVLYDRTMFIFPCTLSVRDVTNTTTKWNEWYSHLCRRGHNRAPYRRADVKKDEFYTLIVTYCERHSQYAYLLEICQICEYCPFTIKAVFGRAVNTIVPKYNIFISI